ncbi:hypothetical protein J2X69_001287 [Algoriphagus sp. 4150]|uniref:hypothetical protein n=1 Tax=Algoriphagus sp. 4150 TaxID=2817756 RepID=UPI00286243FB|nr:hypothetical protein [Algoriphagus sp. 4150]MDR7128952.1 hypothetical protein [Algoriphagus sp. 4150]
MKTLFSTLLIMFSLTIGTHGQSSRTLHLADSLAKEILENEGIYTVMGGLKPISTILHFQFEIDSVSRDYLNEDEVNRQLNDLYVALSLLEKAPVGFVVIPFREIYGNQRSFEVLIYHRESVKAKIKDHAPFFLKRGILPETPVSQVLSQTEFDFTSSRWRAYGYFFGYPDHAVDFFVKASEHEKETKEFVKREFLQIPVSSREEGSFVYAVPQGYQLQEEDILLREQAEELLAIYKLRKSNLMAMDLQYPFLELFWDISKKQAVYRSLIFADALP